MAKLKLGAPPKTFKSTVDIPLLEGGFAQVVFDFKYRTRKEFAEYVDKFIKEASKLEPKKSKSQAKDTAAETKVKTLADILNDEDEANVTYIMENASGWDLDDSFNKDSIKQLITEYPSANIAFGEAYALALTKGRTKN